MKAIINISQNTELCTQYHHTLVKPFCFTLKIVLDLQKWLVENIKSFLEIQLFSPVLTPSFCVAQWTHIGTFLLTKTRFLYRYLRFFPNNPSRIWHHTYLTCLFKIPLPGIVSHNFLYLTMIVLIVIHQAFCGTFLNWDISFSYN